MQKILEGGTERIELAPGSILFVKAIGAGSVAYISLVSSEAPVAFTQADTTANGNASAGPFAEVVTVAVFVTGRSAVSVVPMGSQTAVSGAWKNTALIKLPTSSASFGLTAGTSAVAATITTKLPLPAPFKGARLVPYHRANNVLTGLKALIGVSETMAQTNSATLSLPTLGGTSYAALAGASDVNGYRPVSWGGAAAVDHAASVAAPDIKPADWNPLSSVLRADGGSGYLIMWRTYRAGGAAGNWAFVPLIINPAPTPANRNKEVINCIAYNDAVSNIGNAMALNNTGQDVAVEVLFDRPVYSLWGAGDSIMASHGLVADKVSSWLWRACSDLSTPSKPIVYANFGAAGMGSADYLTNVEAFCAAGITPPSGLVVSISINDVTSSPNVRSLETTRATLYRALAICQKYGIRDLAFASVLPYEGMSLAQDNMRKQVNAEGAAFAAEYKCGWLDFSGVGNGASPELFVPAYRHDGYHPNELAIEMKMTPVAREWLSARL